MTVCKMSDSLGEYFQRAREAKGLTLEEAASKTRILPHYLKAVEENNYARLPDEVFAKGFVRSYARMLGLDEIAVIRKFDESGGQFYAKRAERESLKLKLQAEERRKKINRNIVIGIVGIALVILLVLIGQERERPAPLPAQATAPPSQQPAVAVPLRSAPVPSSPVDRSAPMGSASVTPPQPMTAPAEVERNFSGVLPLEGVVPDHQKLALDIEAVERCWVLVKADHAPTHDVILYPGDRVRWKAQERFMLTLGNAGGVRVYFNGKLQGPYGGSGKVVKDIVLSR